MDLVTQSATRQYEELDCPVVLRTSRMRWIGHVALRAMVTMWIGQEE